jgi:hypothetical protein
MFSLAPCLETFPSLRERHWCFLVRKHQKGDGERETVVDIISTELGRQYFLEHLRREFSEESLICTLMIYELRARPSYAYMQEIVHKCLEFDSPLCVNVPAATREDALSRAARVTPETPPAQFGNIFDRVQEELIILMDSSSLFRFKCSKLYTRYRAREPLPVHEVHLDLEDPASYVHNAESAFKRPDLEDQELLMQKKEKLPLLTSPTQTSTPEPIRNGFIRTATMSPSSHGGTGSFGSVRTSLSGAPGTPKNV